mgnify:CR=1 FL=1
MSKAKAESKAERRPPSVYRDVMDAITSAADDTRPMWHVSCGPDRVIVRASTEHQARQAMLEKVSKPIRFKQEDINRILLEKATAAWEQENASADQSDGVGDA